MTGWALGWNQFTMSRQFRMDRTRIGWIFNHTMHTKVPRAFPSQPLFLLSFQKCLYLRSMQLRVLPVTSRLEWLLCNSSDLSIGVTCNKDVQGDVTRL